MARAKDKFRFVHTNRSEAISAAIKDIKKFNEAKQKEIKQAIIDVTNAVASSAKGRIHNVTGNLSAAISTKYSDAKTAGYVNVTAPHAHLVEFGAKAAMVGPKPKGGKKAIKYGEKIRKWTMVPERKPHPFLKPAAEQEKPKLEAKISEVLK